MGTVLVSSCMLGVQCRYHGDIDNSLAGKIHAEALCRGLRIVPVCPEMLGGLPCPRPAARRYKGRVFWHSGTPDREDVTRYFAKGAEITVETAWAEEAVEAWLFFRSPSCDPETGKAGLALRDADIPVYGWGWPGLYRPRPSPWAYENREACLAR